MRYINIKHMGNRKGAIMYKLIVSACLITAFTLTGCQKPTQNQKKQVAPNASLPAGSTTVDWEKGATFKPETPPLDVAVSADGKLTFVLVAGGGVYIYDDQDTLKATVPTDPSVEKIAVAPQGDKFYAVSTDNKSVQEIKVEFVAQIDTKGSPFKGKADAPIEIVEFSDFECPYCSQVSPLFEEILKNNPDTIKVVFKHYPLPFHKKAIPAALSAIAAQQQGKFWEYHDLLFANQKQLSQEKTEELAKEAGLDLDRFKSDLMSPNTRQKLAKDMQDARNIGVRGTPSLYINGRKIKDRSAPAIQRLIDQELARKNKKTNK